MQHMQVAHIESLVIKTKTNSLNVAAKEERTPQSSVGIESVLAPK